MDLEAFRENTYSRELADLLAVLAATGGSIAPGRVDRNTPQLVRALNATQRGFRAHL